VSVFGSGESVMGAVVTNDVQTSMVIAYSYIYAEGAIELAAYAA